MLCLSSPTLLTKPRTSLISKLQVTFCVFGSRIGTSTGCLKGHSPMSTCIAFPMAARKSNVCSYSAIGCVPTKSTGICTNEQNATSRQRHGSTCKTTPMPRQPLWKRFWRGQRGPVDFGSEASGCLYLTIVPYSEKRFCFREAVFMEPPHIDFQWSNCAHDGQL